MTTAVYLSHRAFGGDLVSWMTDLDDPDSFIGTVLDTSMLDDALVAAEAWWPLCLIEPRQELDLSVCLESAADPEKELAMAHLLGEALLPEELPSYGSRGPQSHPDLIISPAPGLAAIPWEMLQIPGTQDRVCELFNVRMAAPAVVLGAHDRARHSEISAGTYVVDPVTRSGQVLTLEAFEVWQRHVGDDHWGPQRYVDRGMLQAELARQGTARLLFFGHCLPAHEDASATALLLSDPTGAAGSLKALMDGRPLAAHDILTSIDGETGTATWQFPPHVGLVACGSGLDNAYIEPMGLVAAVLERGADTVLASRWALPSDHVTHGLTTSMGIAVDVALATGDPVRSWNDWQREQLTLWKAGAAATTTPALFSAIAAYSMPKGRPAFES